MPHFSRVIKEALTKKGIFWGSSNVLTKFLHGLFKKWWAYFDLHCQPPPHSKKKCYFYISLRLRDAENISPYYGQNVPTTTQPYPRISISHNFYRGLVEILRFVQSINSNNASFYRNLRFVYKYHKSRMNRNYDFLSIFFYQYYFC